MPENKPSITLAMIVKNEAHVIERCLESVKPLLSHWVVVDTGSTDGTQDVIRKVMKGIPGEVYDRPWRGFGKSRTEAFDLAKGKADYALVIDADDLLEIPPGFRIDALDKDMYLLDIHLLELRYKRAQLFRLAKGWRYEGVMHEFATTDGEHTRGFVEGGLVYKCTRDGARSKDPDKYTHDAEVLEQAMKDEPANTRYVFYAAQSWRDARQDMRAQELYVKRAGMGGFAEEVFFSLLEAARANQRMNAPWHATIAAYLKAYENRPSRGAEPLYELARFHRLNKEFALAWLFADAATKIPFPKDDLLFVPSDVYSWRMHDEHALGAYYTGRFEIALEINKRLLAEPTLPKDQRARIEDNILWCNRGIADRANKK